MRRVKMTMKMKKRTVMKAGADQLLALGQVKILVVLIGSNVPVFEPPAEDAALAELKNLKTAYEFYKVFQPDDFFESFLHQSN